jgi:hypothetical protein
MHASLCHSPSLRDPSHGNCTRTTTSRVSLFQLIAWISTRNVEHTWTVLCTRRFVQNAWWTQRLELLKLFWHRFWAHKKKTEIPAFDRRSHIVAAWLFLAASVHVVALLLFLCDSLCDGCDGSDNRRSQSRLLVSKGPQRIGIISLYLCEGRCFVRTDWFSQVCVWDRHFASWQTFWATPGRLKVLSLVLVGTVSFPSHLRNILHLREKLRKLATFYSRVIAHRIAFEAHQDAPMIALDV